MIAFIGALIFMAVLKTILTLMDKYPPVGFSLFVCFIAVIGWRMI